MNKGLDYDFLCVGASEVLEDVMKGAGERGEIISQGNKHVEKKERTTKE